MNNSSAAGPLIRGATADDSATIYALIVDAFGATYLPFTIYRAPQSVSYLARLLTEAQDGSNQQFYVLEHGGCVCGYYHATKYDRQWILSYIAVDSRLRGSGFGSDLLQHFESQGEALSCHELVLDVYASNQQAVKWYRRNGYESQKATYCLRLALEPAVKSECTLNYDHNELQRALDEEARQGFSRLQCQCGNGRLDIGLIAGNTCRLLACEQMSIEGAAAVIAAEFGKRQELIVFGLSSPPETLPIIHADKVFRLAKTLRSTSEGL